MNLFIQKALFYCEENKGMELKLHEKHLEIAREICDGHERCALQASKD